MNYKTKTGTIINLDNIIQLEPIEKLTTSDGDDFFTFTFRFKGIEQLLSFNYKIDKEIEEPKKVRNQIGRMAAKIGADGKFGLVLTIDERTELEEQLRVKKKERKELLNKVEQKAKQQAEEDYKKIETYMLSGGKIKCDGWYENEFLCDYEAVHHLCDQCHTDLEQS